MMVGGGKPIDFPSLAWISILYIVHYNSMLIKHNGCSIRNSGLFVLLLHAIKGLFSAGSSGRL
jgi:hypothetical protein